MVMVSPSGRKSMTSASALILQLPSSKLPALLSASNILDRFFYPLNEETNFKINQIFRKLTKDKIKSSRNLKIKGRTFEIKTKIFRSVNTGNAS